MIKKVIVEINSFLHKLILVKVLYHNQRDQIIVTGLHAHTQARTHTHGHEHTLKTTPVSS